MLGINSVSGKEYSEWMEYSLFCKKKIIGLRVNRVMRLIRLA